MSKKKQQNPEPTVIKPSSLSSRCKFEDLELNTDIIKCNTVFVIESKTQCEDTISVLEEKSKEYKFNIIKTISYNDVINFVKSSKSTANPNFLIPLVFKEIKKELEMESGLRPEILALIIKAMMVTIRDSFEKEKIYQESLNKIISDEREMLFRGSTVEDKKMKKNGIDKDKVIDKKNNKREEGKRRKSKGGIEGEIDGIDKEISIMKLMKKEPKPKACVSTVPNLKYGADVYFTLIKFYDFNLITELLKIGVAVRAIIDIGIYSTVPIESENMSEKFWNDFELKNADITDTLHENTCYIKFDIDMEDKHRNENIYNDLARIIFNVRDLSRLHKEYGCAMKIRKLLPSKRVSLRHMRFYKALTHNVPNESCSVAFILDSVLSEVYLRNEHEKKERFKKLAKLFINLYWDYLNQNLETGKRRGTFRKNIVRSRGLKRSTVDDGLSKLDSLSSSFMDTQIDINEPMSNKSKKKFNVTVRNLWKDYLNLYEEIPSKIIENEQKVIKHVQIAYGSPLDYTMSFFPKANIAKRAALKLLKMCVPSYLFNYGRRNIKCVPYQVYEDDLFRTFPGLTKENIRSGIYACLFLEKFHNTAFQNRYFVDNDKQFLANFMFSNFKTYNVDYKRKPLVSVTRKKFIDESLSYKSNRPNNALYLYSESYDTSTMVQMINVAMTDFRFFDWKYYTPHAILLLRFHNGKNNRKSIRREAAEVYLRTQVSFKDFCSHNMLIDKEWAMDDEKRYWEKVHAEIEARKRISVRRKLTEIGDENTSTSRPNSKSESEAVAFLDSIRPCVFEGYDIGENFNYKLVYREEDFMTENGLTVNAHMYSWPEKDKHYLVKISNKDSHLHLHCLLSKNRIRRHVPFLFNANLFNGTIVTFDKFKDIANLEYNVTKYIAKTERRRSKLIEDDDFQDFRRNIGRITNAIRQKANFYKILSTRSRRYRYIKSIRSQVQLSTKRLIHRLIRKWFSKTNHKNMHKITDKCLPFIKSVKSTESLIYNAKVSLPTGLLISTEHGTDSFYIKQKYITKRKDLGSVTEESHRCFLNNGNIIRFMKDGSVRTMSANKTLSLFEYGCFSSNTRNDRVSMYRVPEFAENLYLEGRKAKTNSPQNRRYTSRYECLRNKKNTYKFSKQLFKERSDILPLLRCRHVTSDGYEMLLENKSCIHKLKKHYVYSYTDYLRNDVLEYRQDGVMWSLNYKGCAKTQFPDETRISSWLKIIDEEYSVKKIDCKTCNKFRKAITDHEKRFHWTSYVVIGIGYKYEHPNYATIIYEPNGTTVIEMPDEVRLTIPSDMEYHLTFDSTLIKTNKSSINFIKQFQKSCFCERCKINIAPLFFKNVLERDIFLVLRDCSMEEFKIEYSGTVKKIRRKQSSMKSQKNISPCEHERDHVCQQDFPEERYFVLRPDLSGQELHRQIPPDRFMYCLHNLQSTRNNTLRNDKIIASSSFQLFYKTYTEKLMMLYDDPILCTGRRMEHPGEFRKLKQNTPKVQPTFAIERKVYHVPKEIMTYWINIVKLYMNNRNKPVPNYILDYAKYIQIDSTTTNEADMKIVEADLEQNIFKRCDNNTMKFKDKIHNIRKTMKKLEYSYFDTEKGMAFLLINECIERAFLMAESGTRRKSILRSKTIMQTLLTETNTKIVTHSTLVSSKGTIIESVTDIKKDNQIKLEQYHTCNCDDILQQNLAPSLKDDKDSDKVSVVTEDSIYSHHFNSIEITSKLDLKSQKNKI